MPFTRPNLAEIIERVDQELASRLEISAFVRRSVLGALARALAGSSHLLHGHLDWIAQQVFPDTAESEHLERWGAVWGVTRKPASAFVATVRFLGTDGFVVPTGTALQRDDGTEYTTQADGTIAGGLVDVAIQASEVGEGPNVEALATLSLVSPIAGVQSSAVVQAADLADGAGEEEDGELRDRILARIQEPPHGGAGFDYPAWALEVSGVTRAWAFPLHLGPGTVGLTFALDETEGGPIPDAGKVAEVQAYIDELRPVTAAVTVYEPVAREITAQIALAPDSVTLRAAVEASLTDLFRREAAPGETLLISHVREAISTTPGEFDHVIELWEGVAPADLAFTASELGALGEVVWV